MPVSPATEVKITSPANPAPAERSALATTMNTDMQPRSLSTVWPKIRSPSRQAPTRLGSSDSMRLSWSGPLISVSRWALKIRLRPPPVPARVATTLERSARIDCWRAGTPWRSYQALTASATGCSCPHGP